MKTIKFKTRPMFRGDWFFAEYYENNKLKYSEGCHTSEKMRVKKIKDKFNSLIKD